jgi:uncharacterized protein (DUF885 family)
MGAMKRWKKVVLGVLLVVLVALAVFLVPTIWGKPWSIDHFYARVFAEYALAHPQMLSWLRVLEPMGLDFYNDDLDDYSIDATRRDLARAERGLETLRRYDRDRLEDTLSYDVLEWFLEDAVDGARWAFHGYPVNQQHSFQTGLADFMINTHQIHDAEDARNYLARLSGFGVAFDQVIASLVYREQMGVVPPRFVMTHVLAQMREFISPPPVEHQLYTHLVERLDEIDDLPADERNGLLGDVERSIAQTVYPAYGRLIDHYAALEPTASTDDGVWKLPDGDEYYAYRLRSYTTTKMSADEIHAIGLREVERIQAQMRAILAAEGLPADDLGATMEAINRDPRFLYPDTDEGRQQVLDDFRAIVDEIDAGLAPLFSLRPEAELAVERVPEYLEDTAAAAYYDHPAIDGSRPGTFYVNLGSIDEIPRFGMRTLAYHEAIPGHHFQIALAQEMQGVPFFRRIIPFTAYREGWALYAEQLAAESGFQQDPYDRLGYLVAQAMRAVRLVVDTGIHSMRWTREEAIEYMLANTGMPEGEVISEVERYIVSPGQATAYMVGYLEIMRLREEARATLGEAFDIREFHRVVLENGDLPLTLLRRQVDAWVEDAGGTPA